MRPAFISREYVDEKTGKHVCRFILNGEREETIDADIEKARALAVKLKNKRMTYLTMLSCGLSAA